VHAPERYPHLPSGIVEGPESPGTGDCIDCHACVNVCPTGVDIREGQQLGCITCALCIDACDDVMARIGKPRGLIDYITLADSERERLGGHVVPIWRRVVRPRVMLYFVLWAGIGAAMVAALVMRSDMTFSIEKVRNPVNIVLSDGAVRNAYEIRLRNKSGYDRDFRLSVASDSPVDMELQGIEGLVVTVPADETFRQRAYVTSPRDGALSQAGLTPIEIVVEDTGSGRRAVEDTVFAGRGQ
jgi:cytochrome c oxidase accessory protein FixG